ncbi:MAG: tRNA uridine-5-carboxymethylaminomethyl(34) synthesis GTPase MnmE [Alphaproteobacteria bacterium]|nr:tRNA uridine-5-carboxymethylaminomethyl(34) synthesis GTPase MnmE [Alphaproteobacteria bacterium]
MATRRRLYAPPGTGGGKEDHKTGPHADQHEGEDGNGVLDDGLMLWFPAPRSFTGEDVAELHIHGGRACIEAVSMALTAMDGVRPAEPGEFTRRAFENGKMDLTQAEALADLVAAETEGQRRQAMGQLSGALSARCDGWRGDLIAVLSDVEASIDFSEEELPSSLLEAVESRVVTLKDNINQYLDDGHKGERLRLGLTAVILGPPNVGKSSLLNRLAGRDAAIVAATAGTTRDVIEVHMDLGGIPISIADTAGLREAEGAIEEEGIRRALERGRAADIKLLVFDGREWPDLDPETVALIDSDALVVCNKADLGDPRGRSRKPLHIDKDGIKYPIYCVSAKTEAGLPEVLEGLEAMLRDRVNVGLSAPLTRARHRAALTETAAALGRVGVEQPIELIAEDLRLAANALGRITGRVDVEDVLDRIFAEFCIGK